MPLRCNIHLATVSHCLATAFQSSAAALQIATLVVVPVQESQGYAIGFGIPTAAFGVAIIAFIVGTWLYVRLPPEGSPFTRIAHVLIGKTHPMPAC